MGQLFLWCLVAWGVLIATQKAEVMKMTKASKKLNLPIIQVALIVPAVCYMVYLALGWYGALNARGLDGVIESQLIR